MVVCLRIKDGRAAIWVKPTSGDKMAPFDDPTAHFDKIRFCSDFQYLSAPLITQVTINHAQVNGVTGTGYTGASAGGTNTGSSEPIANGQVVPASHTLYTHNLGYPPFHMVLLDGEVLNGGAVQVQSGRLRLVSSYATNSIIGLREIGMSSTANLSAVSRTYDVIVFRELAADPAKPLWHVRLDDGLIVMGQGKIDQESRVLRRAADEEEPTFYVPVTRTSDTRNGAIRTISPIGGIKDYGLYIGDLIQAEAIPVTYDGY